MKRMKAERMSRGLTQWDVCFAVGMSESKYSKVESGKVPPTEEEAKKLAVYFRMEQAELFKCLDLLSAPVFQKEFKNGCED